MESELKMKLFILITAIALAQADKLDRVYLPPDVQSSAGSDFLEAPRLSNGFQDQTIALTDRFSSQDTFAQSHAFSSFQARSERPQAAFEKKAAILRQDNSNNGETYAYAYETENGIYGEENGVATNGVQAQGGYSYTGDDGKVYSVRYTADENGFQPQGDHLPTPPPIPEEIQRSLEKNAREEAAGIYDDGSYIESKYNSNNHQPNYIDNNAHRIGEYSFVRDQTAGGVSFSKNQNTYLPPSIQQNNIPRSDSTINGVQNVYLPPIAEPSNQVTGADLSLNSNSFDDAAENSAITGVQKTYIPPFDQRNNQRDEVRQSAFNDSVYARNYADKISATNDQKAYLPLFNQNQHQQQKSYLPPIAERNDQRIDSQQPLSNSNALGGSSAIENYSAIMGAQNAYLPPFGQRNNRRGGMRQFSFNNNVYAQNNVAGLTNVQKTYLPPSTQQNDIARSGSPINGVQKAYLPPITESNYQRAGTQQPTFNSNDHGGSDAAENYSPNTSGQKAYLPPFGQRHNQRNEAKQFSKNGQSSSSNVQNNYLPPSTQQIDIAKNGSPINGDLKAYLPPFSQISEPIFNNNAFSRKDGTEIGSTVVGTQNTYLPPFAQQNNQDTDRLIFYNNALSRGKAIKIGRTFAGTKNAYLPPFAQQNNQDVDRPIFNNNALSRNDAVENSSSFAGIQNTYLPPFGQRIARQATSGSSSKDKNIS